MVAQKILVLLVQVRVLLQQLYKCNSYIYFIFTPQVEDINAFTCGVCVYTDIAGLICSDIIKRYIDTKMPYNSYY